VVVDLAVAEQAEERSISSSPDGAPQAHAVDVVDGNEHGGFISHHAEMIKTAGRPKNSFGFDALTTPSP